MFLSHNGRVSLEMEGEVQVYQKLKLMKLRKLCKMEELIKIILELTKKKHGLRDVDN